MKHSRFAAVVAAVLSLAAGSAGADIAFPARLDVAETETGIYDISFTLPIVEGRKLRAEPLLPPTCAEIGTRESGLSAGGLTTTWRVRCDPASLAGEAILVEGLLGTQTDLAFTLTMLDGRKFSKILRPSRPGFLVPDPPSPPALLVTAAVEGARRTFRQPALWILLSVVAWIGVRPRDLVVAAGAIAVGHFAAQWFGGRGWLEVAPRSRDLLLWISVVAPAVRLAGGGEGWRDWLRPLWPAALLFGLLSGGARPEALPVEGFSHAEQLLAQVVFACGVGAAFLILAVSARELKKVFELTGEGRWQDAAARGVGYAGGALAIGAVLWLLIGLPLRTGGGPREPLELLLVAAVLGPTLAVSGRGVGLTVPAFAVLAVVGAALGLIPVSLPFSSVLVLGSLIVSAGALALSRPLRSRWAHILAAVAVLAGSWSTAYALSTNVSRAPAVTMGVVLVAVCIFFAALNVTHGFDLERVAVPLRFAAGVIAALAVVWRLAEYREWFDHDVATEAALGLARVPLLALSLLVLAILLWPRRRRVAEEFGLDRHDRSRHWLALGAALLVLPYGTFAVPNPFFEPHAPRGEDARRVVSRVLGDTYSAFNLQNEDKLYDTLAENVTGGLVDDLYLDGRRRLTAGTRAGTRVTVRDVSVLEIGEPFGGEAGARGFSYPCRWAVVARVQHLQHVHHRQNLYNGVLTLQPEDGRWKISGVELMSEDRAVVPWNPT